MKPDLRMVDVKNANRTLFKRLKDTFDKPAIYRRGEDFILETRKEQIVGKLITFFNKKYRVQALLDTRIHPSTGKKYYIYLLSNGKTSLQ